MSPTELEARRWKAVFAALTGKRDDLAVSFTPTDNRQVAVEVMPRSWVEPDAWNALNDPGRPQARYRLQCPTSAWREMLADELKGASC
jgi:hypothetical protein